MVYCHHAFQPRCGAAEGCCKVVPALFPHGSSYLLSLFSLFPSLSRCCLVAAGLDRQQECFGVTISVGFLQGAALGSAGGWAKAGVCLSVCPTPVLTLSCICRDQSVPLCAHPASLGMC